MLHLTAETGWINDPHAITWRDGRYHVFFQYVPDTIEWSPHVHWGHAVSSDLIRFEWLPPVLSPGEGDDGIWTGSLAIDGDCSTIFYTSVHTPDFSIGAVRTARPADPDWERWVKGPIVATAPPDLDLIAFRDPFVLRDGSIWRMVLGAALATGEAAICSYRSADLETWEYEGIAARRSSTVTDPVWTGSLWECPQILEVDGRHVLLASVWQHDVLHHVAYGIGRYVNGRFDVNTWGRLTYGPSYYAPSYFRDVNERPNVVLWLRGITDTGAGWIGSHSVPHTLHLVDDRLVATPSDRLHAYRRAGAQDGRVVGSCASTLR